MTAFKEIVGIFTLILLLMLIISVIVSGLGFLLQSQLDCGSRNGLLYKEVFGQNCEQE